MNENPSTKCGVFLRGDHLGGVGSDRHAGRRRLRRLDVVRVTLAQLRYFGLWALVGLWIGLAGAQLSRPSITGSACGDCSLTAYEAVERLGAPDSIRVVSDPWGRVIAQWRYGTVTLGFAEEHLVVVDGPSEAVVRLMTGRRGVTQQDST